MRISCLIVGLCFVLFSSCDTVVSEPSEPWTAYPEEKPNDWFYRQRAYPAGQIDRQKFQAAVRQQVRTQQKLQQRSPNAQWAFQGPMNVGGRIAALDVHPDYPDTIFVGAASGGVFRSYDRGITFEALFEIGRAHV